MSVIAVDNLQYGRVEPYVSLDEVKFSPTASAIDFSNLIENASQNVQDRALSELIKRASSEADTYTMGRLGTLNATANTETMADVRPTRQGEIIVHPYYNPIREITSFSVGWGPGDGMQAITLSTSNCFIAREQFRITGNSSMGLYFGNLGIAGGAWSYMTPMYCQYTYVNGWANTFTTTSTAAGATSIVVTDATGIYPSMQLMVWDGMNDEYVQVASSYVAGSTTVTLTNALSYKHGIGVNVSALPAEVKQAVIHLVVAMIKQRGAGGLILSEIGEPVAVGAHQGLSEEDRIIAYSLLEPYCTIWGQT